MPSEESDLHAPDRHALWFVIDTSFSLAVGAPTHALFNLAFLVVVVPPLLGTRRQRPAPGGNRPVAR